MWVTLTLSTSFTAAVIYPNNFHSIEVVDLESETLSQWLRQTSECVDMTPVQVSKKQTISSLTTIFFIHAIYITELVIN